MLQIDWIWNAFNNFYGWLTTRLCRDWTRWFHMAREDVIEMYVPQEWVPPLQHAFEHRLIDVGRNVCASEEWSVVGLHFGRELRGRKTIDGHGLYIPHRPEFLQMCFHLKSNIFSHQARGLCRYHLLFSEMLEQKSGNDLDGNTRLHEDCHSQGWIDYWMILLRQRCFSCINIHNLFYPFLRATWTCVTTKGVEIRWEKATPMQQQEGEKRSWCILRYESVFGNNE